LKYQHSTTIEPYFAATIGTWPAKYKMLFINETENSLET